MSTLQLNVLAKAIGLQIDSDIDIVALNTLKDATKSNLSFFENKKYLEDLQKTDAGAVLVRLEFAQFVPNNVIAIITDEPYLKLALASKLFAPKVVEVDGNEPIFGSNCIVQGNAFVGKNSTIGNNVTIMNGAYVGDNCIVGNDTIIYPNVTIYRDCKIGSNCIIHAGAVIGGDGFGFAQAKSGEYIKIYQNGNVIIEDDVEIGSNTTIDRAAFNSTIIKKGARIDNLVQIGHNCIIGQGAILTAQVGLAGSSILGDYVIMGAQSGVTGHLEIAPFTTIAARSGVTKSITQKGSYAGFPLFKHREWLKLQAKISRLLKDNK